MEWIGQAGLYENPRYAPPLTDVAAAREVRALVDAAIGAVDFDDAVAALNARDVPWASLTTPAEIVDSEQAVATGCFEEIDDGWGGRMRTPAAPVRFPEGAPPVDRAAPKLGADTDAVLSALAASVVPRD